MFSGYVIDKANINGEKNLCMTDNDYFGLGKMGLHLNIGIL